MPFPDPLSDFCDRYFRAGDGHGRIAAIHRSRGDLLGPSGDTDPAGLSRVLQMLLQYARHDIEEARAEAAGLVQELWASLPASLRQRLFHDGTLLLLEHAPALAATEQRAIRGAIGYGCEHAGAAELERLCSELTESQLSRSLGLAPTAGTWRGAATPAPDMEVMRLIVHHAPAPSWPRLVCDLWRLYNVDMERAESLARGAGLVMSGERAQVMLRRCSRGTEERLELCWDLALSLLERTLREARPEDLGAAAAGFCAWMGALTGIPEEERTPLLSLVAAWSAPALLPVLERWGRETHSLDFQRRVRQALRELRSTLGLGPEVIPARAPTGTGHEGAPGDEPT